MYYSTDENGHIIMSEDIDILPSEYQDLFTEESVSSGDFLSYDDLVDFLAAIPSYNVYPNISAVEVFSHVLNSIDYNIGYIILSGSDSNSTYLYYSKNFSVSGNVISLFSPVTFCNYYSYRPTSSSSYIYTYSVNTVSDVTFTLTNQLVYTNLIEGYPDLIPFKSRDSYSIMIICCILIFLIFAKIFMSKRKV